MKDLQRRTETLKSSFGSSGRISRDFSSFYASKLCQDLPREQIIKYVENHVPSSSIHRIFCESSENMGELRNNSVGLVATPAKSAWISPAEPAHKVGHQAASLSSCLMELFSFTHPKAR